LDYYLIGLDQKQYIGDPSPRGETNPELIKNFKCIKVSAMSLCLGVCWGP